MMALKAQLIIIIIILISFALRSRCTVVLYSKDLQLPSHNFRDIYRDKNNGKIRFKDYSSFDYDGKRDRTKDGIPCKKWDEAYSTNPRIQKSLKYLRPGDMETNFCLNRDHDPLGPWCFKNGTTTSSDDEIGYCQVEDNWLKNRPNCKRTQLGTEYRGAKNVTKSGRRCATWKTRMSRWDPSIGEADNYCRNPDGDLGGPWCYVVEEEEEEEEEEDGKEEEEEDGKEGGKWETCGIEWCDANADADGYRIETKTLPEKTNKTKFWVIQKFDKPKRIVRVELKAGIGRSIEQGKELIQSRNFSLFGSNDDDCIDNDENNNANNKFEKIDSFIVDPFGSQNDKRFSSIISPKYYLCYKILAGPVENPEVLEPHSQVIRDLHLWENLPELTESITVNDVATTDNIFNAELALPHSLLISGFDSPIHATNYSLRISRNIVYRLEGATGEDCNEVDLVWSLLHRAKKSANFQVNEWRRHQLLPTMAFNCFRLSFEKDRALPDPQNYVRVKNLRLAHSKGEPTVEQICGKPTYEQDVSNRVKRSSGRVVGGSQCRKGACPWQAAIIDQNAESFCGGSVIGDRHILTASHCFNARKNYAEMRILLGKTDLREGETSAQTHRIAQVFLHPDFNIDTFENDIAILTTVDKIFFNAYVIPICLPELDLGKHSSEVIRSFVSGWGVKNVVDEETMISSNTLRIARIPLVETKECQNLWQTYRDAEESTRYQRIYMKIDEATICAGGGQVDSCKGDSGGPLIAINQNERFEQIGIVSWGVKASKCGWQGSPPGVYTKVQSHLPWIRDKIRNSGIAATLSTVCDVSQFQCPNGWCVSKKSVCDGKEDCKGGQDEIGCDQLDSTCGTHSNYSIGDLPDVYIQNPWMVVVIDNDDTPRCGGVIVDSLHVLMLRKCIYDDEDPTSFQIRHGANLITGNNIPAISQWMNPVESIIEKGSFLIMRLRQIIKFNNYLRPICSSQPAQKGIRDLKVVGWKEDYGLWSALMADDMWLNKCSDSGRFDGEFCADQCEALEDCKFTGSHKQGDVIVAYQDGRAYLYGIVNSEFHYTETSFSYDPISPQLMKMLRTRLTTSSPTFCGENQFRCTSGVCLDKDQVCDGTQDCKDGMDELICEPQPRECVSAICLHGGSCILSASDDEPSCHCVPGFIGERCQFNINDCANVTCKYGSYCRDGLDASHCMCPPGLTGKDCEIDVDECSSSPCKNGGSCIDKFNLFTCNCSGTRYKGKRCELPKSPCEYHEPCKNGGLCNNLQDGSYSCSCLKGYTGMDCETDINNCSPNPCFNGGNCTDKVDDFLCNCMESWVGKYCTKERKFCDSMPCYHGRCNNIRYGKGYECRCHNNAYGRIKYDEKTDCKVHPNIRQKEIKGEPGGVLIAITRSGLEKAVEYYKRKWEKEMKLFQFGNFDVSGDFINFNGEKENYEIRFEDIRVDPTSFEMEGPFIKMDSNSGLEIKAFVSFKLTANWKGRLFSDFLADLEDSGQIEMEIKGSIFKFSFVLGLEESRKCEMNIAGIDAKVKGSMFNWIYNFFLNQFEDEIKKRIPVDACEIIDKRLEDLTDLLSTTPSSINTNVTANHGKIPVNVDFKPSTRFVGNDAIIHNLFPEVKTKTDSLSKYGGIPPSPFPIFRRTTYDVRILLNEYIVNRVLWVMQKEGFAYWRFSLKPNQSPEVKRFLDHLCWKIGDCKNPDSQTSEYRVDVYIAEPPEVTFTRRPMLRVKFPRININITLTREGKDHRLIDGDFLIVGDGDIGYEIKRNPTTQAINEVKASIDFYNPKTTPLNDAPRRVYKDKDMDKDMEDYWQEMIDLAANDFAEPLLNNLRELPIKVEDNLVEIFKLKKYLKYFQKANDEDGAFMDDLRLESLEGSLLLGANVRMKN